MSSRALGIVLLAVESVCTAASFAQSWCEVQDHPSLVVGKAAAVPSVFSTDPVVIDVAFFFSPLAAREGAMDTLSDHVDYANRVYADSGSNISLRSVYSGIVPDDALEGSQSKIDRLRTSGTVRGIRLDVGADIVVGMDWGSSGVAYPWLPEESSDYQKMKAFAYVGVYHGVGRILSHEVGHLLGLGHKPQYCSPYLAGGCAYVGDQDVDGNELGFSYATVMGASAGVRELPRFSTADPAATHHLANEDVHVPLGNADSNSVAVMAVMPLLQQSGSRRQRRQRKLPFPA